MFWGLIMEPERRYTQHVKKSFHISMAALDIASSAGEPAQVMCGYEGRNYLLCTLKQPEMLQCNLDLEFAAGSQVSFASNGKAHVHLTGYLTDVDEDGLNLADLEEQEEEEDVEEEVEEKPGKKKKLKIQNEQVQPPAKKAKLLNGSLKEEDDEDESDDPDFHGSSEDEVENEDSGEEEASDDDEVNEKDDSEDEEGEEVKEEEPTPPKLTKKQRNLLNKQQQQENGEPKKIKKEEQQQKKQKRSLEKGVIVEDLTEGNGPPAKPGRFVTVYYEGRLQKNNKMFDSSTKGPGFKLRLGSGEVIKAWDIGLVGMKVGGKRKIICPPHTAYGPKGSPPAIPPNATLVFTVELRKIN